MTSNGQCMNDCVLKGNYFCPDESRGTGTCCTDKGNCGQDSPFCSYKAPSTSNSLKWFSCPHTPDYCGESDRVVGRIIPKKIRPR